MDSHGTVMMKGFFFVLVFSGSAFLFMHTFKSGQLQLQVPELQIPKFWPNNLITVTVAQTAVTAGIQLVFDFHIDFLYKFYLQ